MKKTAVSHKPGDIVELAGIKFVVLQTGGVENSFTTTDDMLILALGSQGRSTFGDTNNYAESKLKEAVDAWLYRLTEKLEVEGYNSGLIKNRVIDLTTLDGYKGFGSLEVAAAPLTLDEARKYAEAMPDPDEASWLATGWGGPEHFGSAGALGVASSGGWGGGGCSDVCGVRPALVISSFLLASEDEPDLSEYSTDELLAEVRRRNGVRDGGGDHGRRK